MLKNSYSNGMIVKQAARERYHSQAYLNSRKQEAKAIFKAQMEEDRAKLKMLRILGES